ncbi:MAG: transposase [Acetobacteraceae bacterium]|nr:transposase [Acetobacteraceae bacterium]
MSSFSDHHVQRQAAIHPHYAKLAVSLELSRSIWLVTSLTPGSEKLSKHSVPGGNGPAPLDLLARLRRRAEQRVGGPVEVVVIQEAGLDGFWVHRLLEANGMESHVVDAASIAVPRRHRRAKTDVIDGETLLRTLMAWKRGEPRVCSVVVPPSAGEEDQRRISRERDALLQERIQHTNRIRGLLFSQGISAYNPLRKNRRDQLETLKTGDGRPLPPRLKAQILREIERLEVLLRQIAEVEAERDTLANIKQPAVSGSPANQAVHRWDWSVLDYGRQRGTVPAIHPRRLSGRLPVPKALGAMRIEPEHPIHAPRRRSRPPVCSWLHIDRRQRKQSTNLLGVFAPTVDTPQARRVEI